jgi:hypothetical protein
MISAVGRKSKRKRRCSGAIIALDGSACPTFGEEARLLSNPVSAPKSPYVPYLYPHLCLVQRLCACSACSVQFGLRPTIRGSIMSYLNLTRE